MYASCLYIYTGRQIAKTLRERDCFCLCGARKFNSAKHSFKTAFAIDKGKLSTCTMSNVIEYEYVTGGPLKGGSQLPRGGGGGGGANAPPPPPPERNPAECYCKSRYVATTRAYSGLL